LTALKILDLFTGLGGVAKGFQKWLDEYNIEYKYIAVDINKEVLKVHKYLNPKSQVVHRDAYTFTDDEFKEFDFIWASPPCQSHSRAQVIWKRRKPDMRLYDLIRQLKRIGRPFVVENVIPYYKPPIPWNYRIDRHVLWTNLNLPPLIERVKRMALQEMNIRELAEYHSVPIKYVRLLKRTDKRQALRNMVNPKLSYKLAGWIFPQILERRGG